ncbi:hypothetical protein ABZW10_35935 [Kitasatospora sp. NPDC004723]|uniref:hypothetical protein n=1 Tax=Kitasatospora sp. NPDC004723 TaxID=3154288 RepID=UPI0033BCB3DA
MNTTVTVTADPASPEEMGAAAVTAITETLKAAARRRPPVDRQEPWRIEGTPYSAARITVGDLAARIRPLPDHLLVVCGVPQWNRRAAWPLRSAVWDGALVLHTTASDPDPNALVLDLHLPAPAAADGEAPCPQPAARRAGLAGVLTVGDLAAVLAGLPDHAPVTAVVPGWAGTAELVLEHADDYGDCLLLDTGYSTCDPFGPDGES